MSTKLFNAFAAAAMSVLALACAKEPVTGDGQTVEATFDVDVPGVMATKAIGDGMTASQLYFQVFDAESNPIDGLSVQTKKMNSGKTTVTFQLVKDQTYNFVFWAQTPTEGYYEIDETDGLKKISANYADKNANDENFDAFYAVENLTVNGSVSKEVTLKRPFAQINIATTGKISAGTATKDIDFTDAASVVTVKGIPTAFSPLATTDVFTGNADVTFAKAEVPAGNITVKSTDYKYLAVNYVFAPADGTVYDLNATLSVKGKDVSLTVPTVPAKQNWRTNIVGDLLTSSADFNVVVDPDFGGDQNVAYDEAALKNAIANGGNVVISKDITVSDRLSLASGKTTEITVENGVTLTGELSKYTKVISLFNQNIICTLSGEGTIVGPTTQSGSAAAAIELEDNTNVLTIDGDLTIKGRDGTRTNNVDAGIIIRAGKVVVNSGHFIASRDVDGGDNPAILLYSPNSYRSELIINGGTFESVVGNSKFLINIQDEYRDHASVKIYGGTFIGFDPADNEAEGAHTNFVADGYHSTKVSTDENGVSTYVVSKEGTIPVVNQEGFNEALKQKNSTVVVPAGTFSIPNSAVESVVIEGVEGTVIDMENKIASNYKDVTFRNVTVKTGTEDYKGFQQATGVLTFESCTFTGKHSGYGEKEVYKNCTFNQDNRDYHMWTYGANVDYIGCTFNGKGKFLHVYNEGNDKKTINIEDCTFNNTFILGGKPAINIKGTAKSTVLAFDVNIKNCTVTGTFPATNGGLWQVDAPVSDMSQNQVIVTVDGKVVYPAE